MGTQSSDPLTVTVPPGYMWHGQFRHVLMLAALLPGAWLVAGPFEQGIVGFGEARDDDTIGEASAEPFEGDTEVSNLVLGGELEWEPVSSSGGYLDFMEALG